MLCLSYHPVTSLVLSEPSASVPALRAIQTRSPARKLQTDYNVQTETWTLSKETQTQNPRRGYEVFVKY